MAGAGDADGNGQRHGTVPRGIEARQRLARPRRARRLEKGAALGCGLQEALLGRRHGRGELGDGAQACVVICDDGTMGVNEKHRIAEAAAFADHDGEPSPQCFGIFDIARLDRPLDA
jgi:hypothetical protein